ncbi:hypothetical protein Bbelb_420700 [Branchiostoma belcheri]|nr:hypothetical protein Bbelb_420700 [Branchiostoma belcheri]
METNSTDNDGQGFSPPVRSIDLTLTVAICTVAGLILVGNAAFLCRRRRPKEGAVNTLLLDNLAGSNIGLVVYLSGLVTGDFLHHNGHLSAASLQILCNVEGVLGILFSELSLWLSLTITVSMFVRQVCPRRMRRGKDYLPVYKVIAIAEWMTALILAGFPPALSIFFSKDHAPTVTTYHEVLCLPKGTKTEHKLEFTLFLNCAIILTIFVCLSAVPCCIRGQLKKASLPMEERIIKRDAAVFARMGAAVLIIAIPWVPGLVMFTMTYFGLRIRQTVLQWTLWCVLPSGPAMFPAVYVIVLESTRCRHLLKSCRDKLNAPTGSAPTPLPHHSHKPPTQHLQPGSDKNHPHVQISYLNIPEGGPTGAGVCPGLVPCAVDNRGKHLYTPTHVMCIAPGNGAFRTLPHSKKT